MDMFLYINRDTIVHRLDPRTKLFVLLCSFTVAMVSNSLAVLAALSTAILIYGFYGKVLSNLARIRTILVMIAFFSVVLWAFTKGGPTVLLGPITLEGILFGVITGIKFDIMIISGMIFLSATKIEEIALGLVRLKLPYRGAFAFSTAIRLVPMIVGTSYTITQAQKSRGLDLDSGNIIQKTKKYIPLLVPTLISVIRGTNVFAMALESKGFGYDSKRSYYLQIGFSMRDYLIAGFTIVVTVLTVYARLRHFI